MRTTPIIQNKEVHKSSGFTSACEADQLLKNKKQTALAPLESTQHVHIQVPMKK